MKILKLTLALMLTSGVLLAQGFFTPYQGSLKSKLTFNFNLGTVFQNTDAVGLYDFGNQNFATLNLGGGLAHRMTSNLSFRAYWAAGRIKADPTRDQIFKRGHRDFKTTYIESGLLLEIDWFRRLKFDAQAQRLSITTLVGISSIAFYPYSVNSNKSYRGNPYVVGEPSSKYRGYSEFTLGIPFGGNMKYYIKPQFSVGVETLYRFTGTDFLDGIKAGKASDGFATIMLTAAYTLEPNVSRFNYKLYLKRKLKKHPWR